MAGSRAHLRKYPDLAHLSPEDYRRESGARNSRAYAAAHPGRKQKPRKRAPGPRKKDSRDAAWWRQKRYGITPEQYDELEKAQGSCCALCREKKKLHVDHCHETKRVRGLLCSDCNTGIGKLRENPEVLRRAIEYLSQ